MTQQLGYAVRSKRAAETTSKEERLEKEKQIKGRAKEKEKVAQLGAALAGTRKSLRGVAAKLKQAVTTPIENEKKAEVSFYILLLLHNSNFTLTFVSCHYLPLYQSQHFPRQNWKRQRRQQK